MPRTNRQPPDEQAPHDRPSRGIMMPALLLLAFCACFVRPVIAQEPPVSFDDVADSTFSLEHLRLTLRPDIDARRVDGVASYRITPGIGAPDTLLLFAADLSIDSVRVGTRDSALVATPFRQGAGDSLLIGLDSLIVPQGSFDVRIVYHAQPRRGLYFVHPTDDNPAQKRQVWTSGPPESHRYWFPAFEGPSDGMTTELSITVTPPLHVVANGRLVEETTGDDGTVTAHYNLSSPQAAHEPVFVAGAYQILPEKVRFASGEPPVSLAYWIYPELVGNANRTFGRTPDVLRFFVDHLQTPFPWPSYIQVVLRRPFPEAAGSAGVTRYWDRVLLDERAALDANPDSLIAREAAYQWFGTLLTPRAASDAWLQDGLSTYLGALFTEQQAGTDAFARTMMDAADRYRSTPRSHQIPLAEDPGDTAPHARDVLRNQKGAWVFHMLRRKMGDDLFWKMLGQLLATFPDGQVDTSDLLRVVEGVTFENYTAFFDQWVYAAGHPDLAVRYAYNAADTSLNVTVTQQQRGDGVPDVFETNLVLDAYTLTETFRFEVTLEARTRTFSLPLPTPPRFVLVDPEHDLLAALSVEQPTRAWVGQVRYANDPVSRIQAARTLASAVDDPALLVALRSALLNEPIPAVRAAVIETMGHLPPSDAAQRALLEAGNDEDAAVRIALLKALSNYKDAAVHDYAFHAAQRDPSYRVQATAVKVLAETGSPAALNVARSALVTPSYREVIRQAAFEALPLLDIPSREGVNLGLTYSKADQPAEVRAAAARYLQTYATDAKPALDRLISLLKDDNILIREAAIESLGHVDTKAAREALEKHLTEEPEPHLTYRLREILSS